MNGEAQEEAASESATSARANAATRALGLSRTCLMAAALPLCCSSQVCAKPTGGRLVRRSFAMSATGGASWQFLGAGNCAWPRFDSSASESTLQLLPVRK